MKLFRKSRLAPALLFALLFVFQIHSVCAEKWSFSVFSDSRECPECYRNVLEKIKSNEPADRNFPPADFVVAGGDIDPVGRTFETFKEIIGPSVPFIPVRGNHEKPDDVRFILTQILPSEKTPVTMYDSSSVTYFFDWKNVRFISIDKYAAGLRGMENPALLEWLGKAIKSARGADHVFVAVHEPYTPDRFDSDPFWSLLLKNCDKVRAVFWGHFHAYGHRLITDAYGGMYAINSGNAGSFGHSDSQQTVVQISVDKKEVIFRGIQAPNRSKDFRVTDQWKVNAAEN